MSLIRSAIVLLLVGGLAMPALARDGGRGGRHKDGHMDMNYFSPENMRDLGLTAEQKEKLKQLRQSNREDGKKLHEEMKEARQKFKEVLQSDASKEDVKKAYEAMVAKKSEMGNKRINGILEAREILTKEQRAKLFSKED